MLMLLAALALRPHCAFALEDENWKTVLQQLQEDFRSARTDLGDYDAGLNREIKNFKKGLAKLEKKKGQMILWFGSSYNPEDLNHLLKGIAILHMEAADLLKPFSDIERKLEIFGPKLDEIETEIRRQINEAPAQEYTESLTSNLNDIANLKAELAKVKAHIGQLREIYNDFAARLNESENSARSKASGYWEIYYLQSPVSVFSTDAWEHFRKNLGQWAVLLGIIEESLDGNKERMKTREALLQGLFLTAGLILLGCVLLRKARRKTRAAAGSLTCLLVAWTLLSLSVSIFWIGLSVPFTFYSLSSALAELLLSSGLVSFCSFLRASGREGPGEQAGRNPLWTFWMLFAVSLLFEGMTVPHEVRLTVWPLVLALTGVRLLRASRGAKGKQERIRASRSSYVLLGLALLSIVGFFNLSIIITGTLFYLLLTIVVGLEVLRLLKIWEARARVDGHSLYAIGLISGIGLPACILGLLLMDVWLLSLRLGGAHVFLEILSFRMNWRNYSLTLQAIAFIIVGFYLTKTAISISDTFISELPRNRPDLDDVVVDSLRTLTKYGWWSFFGLFILALLGIDLTSLAVIAGGLSVGIGFGLQHIVNNFFSGLILLLGRSIQSGDTIQIGSILGDVRKVTIRNTVVQTRENATLFIPNSDLITNQLINWSHRDRRVVREISVGVAYESNTEKVTELLLKVTNSHPSVLPHPPPEVLLSDFGSSTLDFKIRFWIENVDYDIQVLSEIRFQIEHIFRENGVEFAYPQTDLHLRTLPALEKLWPNRK